MMHNLRQILQLNILRILYNSLVLPHLNYGILAWGRQTKQLDIIHTKTIRTLTGSNYNSHTEPLFKKMELLKVSDICKLQEIKLYYKFVNKQLPIYVDTLVRADPLRHQPAAGKSRQIPTYTTIIHAHDKNYILLELIMHLPQQT